MNGRGIHEKVYGELKTGFAFDAVPSQDYQANSAWQVLSVMAFNLMRGFQVATTARPRATNPKRRSRFRFQSIHTLRYELVNRAGLVTRPDGHRVLDVGTVPGVVACFKNITSKLRNTG